MCDLKEAKVLLEELVRETPGLKPRYPGRIRGTDHWALRFRRETEHVSRNSKRLLLLGACDRADNPMGKCCHGDDPEIHPCSKQNGRIPSK